MSNELIARAQLFAGVEGGINFWSKEVLEKGPIKVLELCKEGEYKEDTTSILKANGERVLEELAKYGIELIAPSKKFDELPAPPIALTVKGNKVLLEKPSIAIVGTRNPTAYGAKVASEMAANFVDREWVVVSGGAYGIDTAAHTRSLWYQRLKIRT